MELIFCVCSHGGDKDVQLLRSGLFPATFKQIKTLFTFSVLEDFLTDNLECKTTAQQYYSKLQIMTNRIFPNNVPNRYKQLLRASRQWWDLKNRKESGVGHMKEGDAILDGLSDELIQTFIMDGKFSAEHMRHQSGERDISLSAGKAFMANPDTYKAHLRSGKETSQVSLSFNMKDILVALVMYDVMCQYQVHFQKRVTNGPELSIPSSLELQTGIGLFHIHGHQDSCLP
ncbi:hypothetical protein EI94DRAFT_1773684 [Lactarius quietus]|nr:hypothetical protein EI94DRAFT_1773684 [Lactarius quietus]